MLGCGGTSFSCYPTELGNKLPPPSSYNDNPFSYLGKSLFQPDGTLVTIPARAAGESVLVNLDFGEDFTARSISYQVRPRGAKSSTGAMNPPGHPAESFYGLGYQNYQI